MPLSLFESYFKSKGEFKNLELTLNRISSAAAEVGIHDNIAKHIIHIAGTNGKGSTAYFIDQILRHRGQKTALFTSPHIHSVTERIRLNGENIPLDTFDTYFSRVEPLIEKHSLSYFETLTLIAFIYYKDNRPDVAIIETGLGGRFDSTNILDKKTPVITSMSLDHTEYLGNDIFTITDEKLAIIKDNMTVYLGRNYEHVNTYLYETLSDHTLVTADYSDSSYRGFDIPYANNLRLAEKVSDSIIQGSLPTDLKLPMCRMERFGNIVLDGAHNEDGLNLLLSGYKGLKPTAIFSVTKDRDFNNLYSILKDTCSDIIVTEIPDNDRSINIGSLPQGIYAIKSPEQALKIAVELSENTDILVCGSLYLCGYIREILTKGNV